MARLASPPYGQADQPRGLAIWLFIIQFAVNLAWSPVFFAAHQVTTAFWIIIAMLVLAAQLSTNIFVPRFGPKIMVPTGMVLATLVMGD